MRALRFITLVGFISLSGAQSQFQTQFQNFQAAPRGAPEGAPRGSGVPEGVSRGRGVEALRSGNSRTNIPEINHLLVGEDQGVRSERRETTTPVSILKQINEHNEDGSYSYGYEAADGTFKLETRFVDGTVQGKYGYVDENGEVKIIEYGANAMGFQPQGDLPEGIIIPPPVAGNCTDCDYDYDYQDKQNPDVEQDRSNRVVLNRSRGDLEQQPRVQQAPSQNRGQDLNQPITDPPLPKRPASEPGFSQSFSAFPAAPAFQPRRPEQETFSRGSIRLSPVSRPEPEIPQARPAPAVSQPEDSENSDFSSFPARNNPARARSNSRPAPRSQIQEQTQGFSRPSSIPREQVSRVSPQSQDDRQINIFRQPAQVQQEPILPAFSTPSNFNSFPQVQAGSNLPSRPSTGLRSSPVAQEVRQEVPEVRQRVPDVRQGIPEALPKSALEIVDFNQLVQQFQGARSGQQQLQQQQQQLQPQFQSFQDTGAQRFNPSQARFSTENFPVRY